MIKNLFDGLSVAQGQERFDELMRHQGLRIERIVSHGYASPAGFWYDQAWDEWVVLLTGEAELAFEDKVLQLVPGDHVMIAARQKHRIRSTSTTQLTVWLAIHWDESQ